MTASSTRLDDRAVVAVSGPDARSLLQRLLTNDVEHLAAGEACYAALLTPQGKIIADFFVVAPPNQPDTLLLDCPAPQAADLVKRFSLYKLRAKADVTLRGDLGVALDADGGVTDGAVVFADPRAPGLWARRIAPRDNLPEASPAALNVAETARLTAGVPTGGVDYPFGDTFPHDANLDQLHGVNFRKGCYVGQEVVSRVQHRGTARKRIVPVSFDGPAPAPGSEITAGDVSLGQMGSSQAGIGLALLRVDRAAEAEGSIGAGGTPLRVTIPAWA